MKVVSAKEHISEGSEGIILEAMLQGYTEFYSAELSEKIHRRQKENALKGKNNGGGVPLGYLLDKKAHISCLPKVQKEGVLWRKKRSNWKNSEAAVRMERCGNPRGGDMSRPCTYAGEYSTEGLGIVLYGVPEGEEQYHAV